MSDNNDPKVQTSRAATFFSTTGWWTASAVFITLVGIAVLVIFLVPNHHHTAGGTAPPATGTNPPPPLSSPAASPSSTASASGWADLGCNGTKGSPSIPVLPPKVTWVPLGRFTVPTSKTYGPAATDGPLRHCYQHTPTGALLAAFNSPFTISAASPADFRSVVDALTTPGVGRDKTIAAGPGTGGKPIDMKIQAYQIDSCSPDRCNLELVFALNGGLLQGPTSMVWSGGDWKTDGASSDEAHPIQSVPAGFTNFSAGGR